MSNKRGEALAVVFFLGAVLCCINPDVLPVRDWFNHILRGTFGYFQ
ncbi:MAG: hypothetical protein KDA93_15665 [Planctomycetaceae bacterium]|nr:hypothetical protein [Planctomycetaceae bacterium]